jgi:hypothetical protein
MVGKVSIDQISKRPSQSSLKYLIITEWVIVNIFIVFYYKTDSRKANKDIISNTINMFMYRQVLYLTLSKNNNKVKSANADAPFIKILRY